MKSKGLPQASSDLKLWVANDRMINVHRHTDAPLRTYNPLQGRD